MGVFCQVVLFVICCFTAVHSRPNDGLKISGVGRSEARRGEFPYFALIMEKLTQKIVIAGILIRPNVVLCVGYSLYVIQNFEPSELVAVFGTHNRSLSENTRQEIDVEEIVIVFPLKKINSKVKEDNKLAKGGNCVSAGYGYIKWNEYENILPRTLQKYAPQIQRGKICDKYVKKEYNVSLPRTKWLCSLNEDLTESRNYDGGNPLLCSLTEDDGDFKLYGLVAGGSAYYEPSGFTYFTKISAFHSWIITTAKSLSKS